MPNGLSPEDQVGLLQGLGGQGRGDQIELGIEAQSRALRNMRVVILHLGATPLQELDDL